ncbi:MAG: hypothetical protein ABW360_18335 [Phenylobacterium sp.]
MVACSWIAVRGLDRASVLASLEFEETGRKGSEDAFSLWCADLPGGWLLVESHDLEFASPARIAELSRHGWAIGCLVEGRVMFSGVRFCEQGRERWWVLHDAEKGIYDLSMGGDLPVEFASTRDRLFAEQDAAGGSAADVDFIFDVPMALADAITGYRAEGGSGERPVMTELKPIRRAGSAGLFAKFLRPR